MALIFRYMPINAHLIESPSMEFIMALELYNQTISFSQI